VKRAAFVVPLAFVAFLLLSVSASAQAPRVSWSLPADFSSSQGAPGVGEWYYYRVSGSTYLPLVWDPYVNGLGTVGNCWSPQAGGGDDPRFLYIQGVTGSYMVVQTGENANAAIGWRAPRAGVVNVSATMTAVSTSSTYSSWCGQGCDDGIYLSIKRADGTDATERAHVLHGSATIQSNGVATTFAVAAGEFVYFYVDRGNWQDADAAYANYSVTYEVTDRTWEEMQPGVLVSNRLNDVAAIAANDIWAVGSAGAIMHYTVGMMADVGVWQRVADPFNNELYAVDFTSAGEGRAVGEGGRILRYTGGAWVGAGVMAGGANLYALDMISDTEGWAAGAGGRIFHFVYGGWHQETIAGLAGLDTRVFDDLQMLSPTDGWAVGTGGAILHYDGTAWRAVACPTNRELMSIDMLAAGEGWAVGDHGTILHYTSAAGWQAAASPVTTPLRSVGMSSPTQGWAVGDGEQMLHLNGGAWHVHASPTGMTLRSVAMVNGNNGWAVGSNGTIVRYGQPSLTLELTRPVALVNIGSTASFVLTVRDATGALVTNATVTAELRDPATRLWGGGTLTYQAGSSGYPFSYTLQPYDMRGAYSVYFRVSVDGYATTTRWSYFGAGNNDNVWVLLLTNYTRMRALGYGETEVGRLRSQVYDLAFGNPNGLGAVVALENVPAVSTAYTAWAASPGDGGANNTLAYAVDAEIERLRRDVYHNLYYVIIVGSSEIIPMYARADDPTWSGDWEDEYWSTELSDASYVRSLSYHGEHGRYLTDNVYADLAYLDSSGDHELTPELAVGRLIETPQQIGRLITTYLSLHGSISAKAIVMASHDQLDTGNAVFTGYPGGVDRSNVSESYPATFIPAYVSSGKAYVIAGHASRSNVNAGSGSFAAGGCGTDVTGTYDVLTAAGSVMFTVSCHAGVTLGNKLHGDPASDDRSCPIQDNARYLEFPETWANLGMLAYAGSTSYAMGTASGSTDYASLVGGTEALVARMTEGGRLTGRTIGQAFRDGMNAYWNETSYCLVWLPYFGCVATAHSDYSRKAIGGYTLYGIPTLMVNGPVTSSELGEAAPVATTTLQRQVISASATQAVEQITLNVPIYRVDPVSGAVEIPGAVARLIPGEPLLPVLTAERALPLGVAVTDVSVDVAQSTYDEVNGRLPLPDLMGGDTVVANGFGAPGFYPAGLALSVEGLGATGQSQTVGVSLIPVQYDPVAGRVRVWTRIVVNVTYSLPDTGVAIASLVTDKGLYDAAEAVALTAAVANSGGARTADASAHLYNARTGVPFGELSLGTGIALPPGSSSQPLSLALADMATSLEGRQVRIEVWLSDSSTGALLASADATVAVTDHTPPPAPESLRGWPADKAVSLLWQLSSHDDVWAYRIYWGTDPSSLGSVVEASPFSARYTVPGLTNMTTYYFAVSAVDLAGQEGGRSPVQAVMPGMRVYLPVVRQRGRG
jgi:hypothetical protein